MREISATDAARNFAGLLDAVEHRGERFTIVRRGRVIAQLEPITTGHGSDVKLVLRGAVRDRSWRHELAELRELLAIEDRS